MNTLYKNLNYSNKILNNTNVYKNIINDGFDIEKISYVNKKLKSKEAEIFLNENTLFLLKNNWIKKYINLNFIGFKYNKDTLNVVLFTNKKFLTLKLSSLKQWKNWKRKISKICIFNNFNIDFIVIKKLNYTKNLKIYLANKKLNKLKLYTILLLKKDDHWTDSNSINKFFLRIENYRKVNGFKYLYESSNSFYLIFKYDENIINKIIYNKPITKSLLNIKYEENINNNPKNNILCNFQFDFNKKYIIN